MTVARRWRGRGVLGLAIVSVLTAAAGSVPGRARTDTLRRAFDTRDWYKIRTVAATAISPDGKYVAAQVTSIIEARNARVNEIWVVPTAQGGGEPVRFSAPGFDSTNPRFSPDSTLVIFTSTRPGYPGRQWAARVDRPGGEFPYTAEIAAEVAIDSSGDDFTTRPGAGFAGVGSASSTPKDGSFVVTTGVPGAPVPGPGVRGAGRGGAGRGGAGGVPPGGAAPAGRGASPARDPYSDMPVLARPPVNAITLPLDPARFDGMQLTDARIKANGRGYLPSTGAGSRGAGRGGGARGAGQPPTQVLIDRKDGAGPQPLTSTAYSHRNAVVSPDGRWIVFSADAELRSDADVRAVRTEIAALGTEAERTTATRERLASDLFVVPADAAAAPKRIRTPGTESGARWSPDSRWIAFTAGDGTGTTSQVYLADVATATSRSLTADLRTDVGPFDWLPSNDLLMQLTIGGRTALARVNPRSGQRKEIVGGRRHVTSFVYDAARTKVAYIATSADLPGEVYETDLSTGVERQLTDFNRDLNAAIAWCPSERFTFTSVGGVEIEAWLVRPYGYTPGKKYPLVLSVHGGPHSAYTEGWFDEFQNLSGAGMWVLYTNPRGSSGYGGEFQDMIRDRWGDEDYQDLMKAVDIAAARPDVDATNLGVTGGSYGGFMTAWITTKTSRFKAAEADRMIANWVSWYGNSDAQSLTEGEFLGNPWQNWDAYVNMSPIKYADKVRTPTLIVQSEEDYRAPIEDAEQWYMALQKHNVPVEFVRYPRSNHDLSRTGEPWLLTDRLYRIREWFSYWLEGEKPARAVRGG